MQVSLVNRSGIPVKGGEFVKLHSRYKDSFVVCDYWDIEKFGTVAEAGYPGRWVVINLFNTINYSDIIDPQGSAEETFESVSKNLKGYPYVFTYNGEDIDFITYDLGSGQSIVKSFTYADGVLTNIVLSGNTPSGISLTKTFHYTGENLTSISYS